MNATTTTRNTKMAVCRVRFQGYDWENTLTVTSPTGRSIRLECNGKWKRMSPELDALVCSLMHAHASEYSWGDDVERTLSYAIMAEIKALATPAMRVAR